MRFGTSDTPTVAMIRSVNVGVTSAIDNGVSASGAGRRHPIDLIAQRQQASCYPPSHGRFPYPESRPRVSPSRARAVEDAPSIFRPRSANPLEHVLLSRIGSITRPSHGLFDLQHHDVLATGYVPQLISYVFSAHADGLGGDQPKSRNPVPPPQILCPDPFNEGGVFGQSHVFHGHRKSTFHGWFSLLC